MNNMKENQKTLINSRIEVQELEKYSKIITKKSLRVIACNGSIYALKLLENRDLDTLNDLYQEVSLQIVLDDYVITRNAYKIVRKYIYNNYEKNECEIFTTEENQELKENQASYISYLSNSNKENPKKATRIDTNKLYELLSDTEKKIYNFYFINNMKQIEISKMLDIKKQNITTYINRIKQKAVKCI